MSLSLYELTAEYLEFLNFITDPAEELDKQTIADTLESLDFSLDEKLLNTARVIASMEAEAEAIAEVELRQRNRRQTLENKAGWLRDYLASNMTISGHTALKSPDIALKLAKLPVSVIVLNEDIIPAEFWNEKVTRTVNKVAIKEAGGCIGTSIESKGYRVSIK